jgi:2-keto-3-deoxy-L-rhamnonate aldolase RhmA
VTTARPRSPLDGGDLRRRVTAGEATLGTFVGTASSVTGEVCAAAGFDWLLVDLEHGSGGEEQVRSLVPVAAAYGVPTIVRAESAASAAHEIAALPGKACGLLVGDGAAAALRMAEAWTFVAIGSDSTPLASAAVASLNRARQAS